MEIQEKTVLVTGASSGIGSACAKLFARHGARLILTARSKQKLADVARQVSPAETLVIPADLTDPGALADLCQRAMDRFAAIDVVINNAGVGLYAPSFDSPPDKVRELFELNFLAPVELIRRLMPAIPKGGAIVNISSIAGKVPLPWHTLYSASKYALNAYSDGLRMELARAGIQVLCVCPGYVDTPFRENVLEGRIPEKVAGQKRFMVTAEECAEAILNGLRRNKRTVVTPRVGWLLVAAARLLPSIVYGRMGRITPVVTLLQDSP